MRKRVTALSDEALQGGTETKVRPGGWPPAAGSQVDLFDFYGVVAARQKPAPVTSATTVVVRTIAYAHLTLYKSLALHTCSAPASCGSQAHQLVLDLDGGVGNVVRFIPRSHSAFVNMRLVSFFARDRLLYAAAEELVRQNLLYLGDLAPLTLLDLRSRLGRHAACTTALAAALERVGVFLNARAPWWSRPLDYYG